MPLTPPLSIVLDLDGVFANFNAAFALQLVESTGKHLVPAGYIPDEWHWPQVLGYTQREVDRTWGDIDASGSWWLTRVNPYEGTVRMLTRVQRLIGLQRLQAVFVTARLSPNAHYQTVRWLEQFGIEHPQVLVAVNAKHKAHAALVTRATLAVDDHTTNVIALAEVVEQTICYTQPWNVKEALVGTPHTRAGNLLDLMAQIETAIRDREENGER